MSQTVTKPEILNDEEIDNLLDIRPSVDLTPQNARFYRSAGGLISMELMLPDKDVETFERVVILRSFPISNPNEFLSVRIPDANKGGRGREIGLIRRLSDFDEETARLIDEELSVRYFSPKITKILSIKEKFGYYYWEMETTSGRVSIVLNNPYNNIRVLEDGSVHIVDMDGNCFDLPDPRVLDKASYKKLDIYL